MRVVVCVCIIAEWATGKERKSFLEKRAKQHANSNSPPPGKLRVIQSRLSYFSHSMWRRLLFWPAQFSDQWENILVQQHFYHAPLFIYPLAEEKMGSNGRSRVHNTRKQNFGLIRPSIAFLLMQKFRVHCEYTHAVVKNHKTLRGCLFTGSQSNWKFSCWAQKLLPGSVPPQDKLFSVEFWLLQAGQIRSIG